MSPVVDATGDDRGPSIDRCVEAVRRGEVVVIPTDTVYGIGADAFDAAAVAAVLEAKGRGRDMPPPVLVPDVSTVDGLSRAVPDWARTLVDTFWPGPLTLVLKAQPTLHWDLGETAGTVALRMPDDEVALAVLRETGPLAVTSANRTGQPAATNVTEAAVQLGPAVSVYVDGGPRDTQQPSTIIDCTGERPEVLRQGAVTREQLVSVLGAGFDRPADAGEDAADVADQVPEDAATGAPPPSPADAASTPEDVSEAAAAWPERPEWQDPAPEKTTTDTEAPR